jgi:hypothetical protein
MRLSYLPTYSQFVENYIATHYSSGVGTFRRLAGGPTAILAGALLTLIAYSRLSSGFFRVAFIIIGSLTILAGIYFVLQPLFNILLVRLRREELFGSEIGPTTIELKGEYLNITENQEKLKLPIHQIKSIQHRAESTWILTEGDYLVFVPRNGLIEGDHDLFITSLETLLEPDEEE